MLPFCPDLVVGRTWCLTGNEGERREGVEMTCGEVLNESSGVRQPGGLDGC